VHLSWRQVLAVLAPYLRQRLLEQVKAVWLIVLYLVVFQTLVLGIPVFGAGVIALGIVLVVVGLTFFMEGLLLGLMPLGEAIGVKLPQKSRLPTILAFAFVLGVGATFAEPAIGVLKVAGASVKAWEAPLLFLLLNRHANLLVAAVGVGVGVAVVMGMLRFLHGWSLRPFIYVLVPLLLGLSAWGAFEPNMAAITGLAWDSGAVTTGPVTVPLVLALGIGVCRVVSRDGGGGSGGFGVVTLASAVPILAVLLLGAALLGRVPAPMDEQAFLSAAQRSQAQALFETPERMTGYVLRHAGPEGQLAYFDGDAQAMADFLRTLASSAPMQQAVFGPDGTARFAEWAARQASAAQRLAMFGSDAAAPPALAGASAGGSSALLAVALRNVAAAVQAILPLSLLFFAVLWGLLRERVKRLDELLLGLVFAVVGMTLFSIGIELGLSRLGTQAGEKLPAAFKAIELVEQRRAIPDFDLAAVHTAVAADGRIERFFFYSQGGSPVALPFDEAGYDAATGRYVFTPRTGPLFGSGALPLAGLLVVLGFAFVMGYGATLAEPALNALGRTVEELTAGAFRKALLMHAVAVGVGLGMLFGVAKILWGIPLVWLLAPPYLLLLPLTHWASEEFVNIGWDSAGVTTGPITVPLVLAMGLGIGAELGVTEGFGILALASVYPIVCVLGLSLWMTRRRRGALAEGAAAAVAPGDA
jgi:hypothetical protein